MFKPVCDMQMRTKDMLSKRMFKPICDMQMHTNDMLSRYLAELCVWIRARRVCWFFLVVCGLKHMFSCDISKTLIVQNRCPPLYFHPITVPRYLSKQYFGKCHTKQCACQQIPFSEWEVWAKAAMICKMTNCTKANTDGVFGVDAGRVVMEHDWSSDWSWWSRMGA